MTTLIPAAPPLSRLVLLRHGQSQWNLENRFTGWADVDLSPHGQEEARHAGQLLRSFGFEFDVAYASVLKRAIRTLWVVLDILDQMWVPTTADWRLNERDYGALQGVSKTEATVQFGAEQVQAWRRGYTDQPPKRSAPQIMQQNRRYRELGQDQIPCGESLEDTAARVVPFWERTIAPQVRSGKTVLVVAHGNSLRALIKHLEGASAETIAQREIPTAQPFVYELDPSAHPTKSYYLRDLNPADVSNLLP